MYPNDNKQVRDKSVNIKKRKISKKNNVCFINNYYILYDNLN